MLKSLNAFFYICLLKLRKKKPTKYCLAKIAKLSTKKVKSILVPRLITKWHYLQQRNITLNLYSHTLGSGC